MNALLLLLQVTIPLLAGTLVTLYLSAVTRRVLVRTCGTGEGADFWLRMSAVANLATPLVLVLIFARTLPAFPAYSADFLVDAARQVAYLSLIGIMGALAIVARAMYRQIPAMAAASSETAAP